MVCGQDGFWLCCHQDFSLEILAVLQLKFDFHGFAEYPHFVCFLLGGNEV